MPIIERAGRGYESHQAVEQAIELARSARGVVWSEEADELSGLPPWGPGERGEEEPKAVGRRQVERREDTESGAVGA